MQTNHALGAALCLLTLCLPLLTVASSVNAQERTRPNSLLAARRSLNHARVPTDLSSGMVLPMPMPRNVGPQRVLSDYAATREVEHDLATGQTWVSAMPALQLHPDTSWTASRFESRGHPGNAGADARVSGTDDPIIGPQTIVGTDDRLRVVSTTTYPWRAVCQVRCMFPNSNGVTTVGTGVLVAPKYLLTAGHMIYNTALGGWATSVEVIPGRDDDFMPYYAANGTYMRTYTGWTQNGSFNHDFALVTLDDTIGDETGWLGFAYLASLNGVAATLDGYPGDLTGGNSQWYGTGPIRRVLAYQLTYRIDTTAGQSGSGLWTTINNNLWVFAVHSWSGTNQNGACRIDRAKFNSLNAWIATGY